MKNKIFDEVRNRVERERAEAFEKMNAKDRETIEQIVTEEEARQPKEGLSVPDRFEKCLIVPDEQIKCGTFLTHGEYRLWQEIFHHDWEKDEKKRVCWPGKETLAILMGVSTRQLETYLRGLKDKELLTISRRRGMTTYYHLLDIPKKYMLKTEELIEKAKVKRHQERVLETAKRIQDLITKGRALKAKNGKC